MLAVFPQRTSLPEAAGHTDGLKTLCSILRQAVLIPDPQVTSQLFFFVFRLKHGSHFSCACSLTCPRWTRDYKLLSQESAGSVLHPGLLGSLRRRPHPTAGGVPESHADSEGGHLGPGASGPGGDIPAIRHPSVTSLVGSGASHPTPLRPSLQNQEVPRGECGFPASLMSTPPFPGPWPPR